MTASGGNAGSWDSPRSPRRTTEYADLGGILDHLGSLIQAECARKQLIFEAEWEPPLPEVRGDSSRLEQAILNLLRNAMESMPNGGRFGLSAGVENGHAIVRVWDQGPGIPADLRTKIFEPFFTTKEKGTGLGLAITSEIIREEGGSVTCESAPDRGTTFTLQLPTRA